MKRKALIIFLIIVSTIVAISAILLSSQQIKKEGSVASETVSRNEKFRQAMEESLDSECEEKGLAVNSEDCLVFQVDGLNYLIRQNYPYPMETDNSEGMKYHADAMQMLDSFSKYVDEQCTLEEDYLKCKRDLYLDRVVFQSVYGKTASENIGSIPDVEDDPTIEERLEEAISDRFGEFCSEGGGDNTYEMIECQYSIKKFLEKLLDVSTENGLEKYAEGGEGVPTDSQLTEVQALITADTENFPKYAKNHCDFVSTEYQGGTLQPVIYALCYNRLLREEIMDYLEYKVIIDKDVEEMITLINSIEL